MKLEEMDWLTRHEYERLRYIWNEAELDYRADPTNGNAWRNAQDKLSDFKRFCDKHDLELEWL